MVKNSTFPSHLHLQPQNKSLSSPRAPRAPWKSCTTLFPGEGLRAKKGRALAPSSGYWAAWLFSLWLRWASPAGWRGSQFALAPFLEMFEKLGNQGRESRAAFICIMKVTILTILHERFSGVLCLVAQSCLFVTLWTVAHQAPLSMGFSQGKNTGVGCHAFLQRIFPTQESNPDLPHCRWILKFIHIVEKYHHHPSSEYFHFPRQKPHMH